MRVLFIYRSPQMGFSIGNVFNPIEKKMKKKCECDSITFTNSNYKIMSLIQNIIMIRKYMNKHPNTIIHITGAENYLLPFLRKYKTIVTVHDLGFYTRNKKTLKLYLKFPLWIASLKLANKVVFISEKSKLEAEQLIKFKKNQVNIIMNPVNEIFKPLPNKKFNYNKPIILQIGTYENKNLKRVIEAIKNIDCHFRIIGKLDKEYKDLLEKNNIEFSQVQDISNEQVVREYQNCDIVCFASIYEGFGMPIIEGQATGKVVVTSNISPTKEIANNSCPLVNPLDVQSINEGIIDAINNNEKYKILGMENIKRFTLDAKVDEYFNLYKELNI